MKHLEDTVNIIYNLEFHCYRYPQNVDEELCIPDASKVQFLTKLDFDL